MRRSYRVCLLDGGGEIMCRLAFEAEDDASAVAHVRRIHPENHCDLWELGRYVALIPASAIAACERAAHAVPGALGIADYHLLVPAA